MCGFELTYSFGEGKICTEMPDEEICHPSCNTKLISPFLSVHSFDMKEVNSLSSTHIPVAIRVAMAARNYNDQFKYIFLDSYILIPVWLTTKITM